MLFVLALSDLNFDLLVEIDASNFIQELQEVPLALVSILIDSKPLTWRQLRLIQGLGDAQLGL